MIVSKVLETLTITCQKFWKPNGHFRFVIICSISNKFIHKIKAIVVATIASSQRCGSKLYVDMDYKVKPNIGMKARTKSAYKQNPINAYLWLLYLNQWGLKFYEHHIL
jgi:hypothetical protein